jgi:type VI secretion system protein ImpE
MTAEEMYRHGRLTDAIAALGQHLRREPADLRARVFLAELLCFNGEIERADRTLDIAGNENPEAAVQAARLRQTLRAEIARREVWTAGRVPEFRREPTPMMQAYLQALVSLRAGDAPAAARALALAEAHRSALAVRIDEKAFSEFRDADDTTAGFLEVLTAGGSYYWIAFEEVRSLIFVAPATPLDLMWRTARIEFADDSEGTVSVAAIYPGSEGAVDDTLRLGRATEWLDIAGEMMRGLGQRCFFADGELLPMTQIKSMEFNGS